MVWTVSRKLADDAHVVTTDAIAMIRTTALTLMVMAFPIGPNIRYVPRTVDPAFTTRFHLCEGVLDSKATVRDNEAKLSLAEIVGRELVEVQVHQLGEGFQDFDAAAEHIRELLKQRPRVVTAYPPWAEATPLAVQGILGTLHYREERAGVIEIAGVHACFQDRAGKLWWVRLASVDVWP